MEVENDSDDDIIYEVQDGPGGGGSRGSTVARINSKTKHTFPDSEWPTIHRLWLLEKYADIKKDVDPDQNIRVTESGITFIT